MLYTALYPLLGIMPIYRRHSGKVSALRRSGGLLTGVPGGQGRVNAASTTGAYDRQLPPKTPRLLTLTPDTAQPLPRIRRNPCRSPLPPPCPGYGATLAPDTLQPLPRIRSLPWRSPAASPNAPPLIPSPRIRRNPCPGYATTFAPDTLQPLGAPPLPPPAPDTPQPLPRIRHNPWHSPALQPLPRIRCNPCRGYGATLDAPVF